MAGVKQFPNGTWQYTFTRAGLLERPIYKTFQSKEEGDAFAERVEALLDKGIIPGELQHNSRILTISDLVREYSREAHPSRKDQSCLRAITNRWGSQPLLGITARWVDDWISGMKRIEVLAPASIRARVGALARCTDWGMRKGYLKLPDHPLRTLPKGYAQYTELDAKLSGRLREDVERDRRLEEGEHERIIAAIEQGRIPQKQRDYIIADVPATLTMYLLALETAMRMREIYTLDTSQISLSRRTVFLDTSKNGDKRQVPLSSVAVPLLKGYMKEQSEAIQARDGRLFPWWSGDMSDKALVKASDDISKMYKRIFNHAKCENLTFHDLRHEATSRLFEKTSMTETKIMKITGHRSHKVMMRYANLRGSSLADEMW